MPIIDPFFTSVETVERPVYTVTLDTVTGQKFTMRLRKLDDLEESLMQDTAELLIYKYVAPEGGQPREEFPAINGEPVIVSQTLCYAVARLHHMQPEDTPERYLPHVLIGCAALFRHTGEFQEMYRRALRVGRGEDPNTEVSVPKA